MAIDFKKTDTNGDKTLDAGELLTAILHKNPITDGELKVLLDNPKEFEAKANEALAKQGFKLADRTAETLHVLAEHGLLPHKPAQSINIR